MVGNRETAVEEWLTNPGLVSVKAEAGGLRFLCPLKLTCHLGKPGISFWFGKVEFLYERLHLHFHSGLLRSNSGAVRVRVCVCFVSGCSPEIE